MEMRREAGAVREVETHREGPGLAGIALQHGDLRAGREYGRCGTPGERRQLRANLSRDEGQQSGKDGDTESRTHDQPLKVGWEQLGEILRVPLRPGEPVSVWRSDGPFGPCLND